jgi:hypothetical protein
MHFTQQSALAVAVLASSAFAAPMPKGGKYTASLEKAGGFASAANGVITAGTDIVNGAENLWHEITSRDLEGQLELATREPKGGKNTAALEKAGGFASAANGVITAGTDIVNGAENFWHEITSRDLEGQLEARDILDDVNAEVNNLTQRDVEARAGGKYTSALEKGAGFAGAANSVINAGTEVVQGAENFWHEITSRDILDDVNTEVDSLTSRGLESDAVNFWHEISSRDILDDVNAEVDSLTTRGLESDAVNFWHDISSR